MTLKEKGSVAATTRRAALYGTAAAGSFVAASLITPGVASACHNYPGGCYQKRRDEAAGRTSSSSSSSSPSSNSSSQDCSKAAPTASSDKLPYGGQFFGCHVNGGGIGNLPVKGSTPVAQRFRAEASGYVKSVRVVQKYTSGSSNYSSGNGGVLSITIRSSLDGPVLGTTGRISSPKSRGQHPIYRFTKNVALQKGKTYYLQFDNSSSSAYLSINCLHSFRGEMAKPLSAWPFQANSMTSYRKQKGRWVLEDDHIPIFVLHYTNGLIKGSAWYQGVRGDTRRVGGGAAVRQKFVPNRSIRAFAVSLHLCQRSRSSSNMNVRLTNSSGSTLASGTLSRYDVPVKSNSPIAWKKVNFNKTVTLQSGGTYYVVCEAPGGGNYEVMVTQNASKFFGFKCDKAVTSGRSGGRAEYSYNGRSWSGFTHHGKRNRPDCDMGCLLHLV